MNNMKNEDMEKELRTLRTLLADIDANAEVVPASELFPMPSLAVWADGERREGGRVVVINYIPYEEGAENTSFMQFYIELPMDLSGLGELELLQKIDKINRSMPIGHCMTVKERADMPYKKMIGARYVFGVPDDEPVPEETFMESLILFISSCDMVMEEFGFEVPEN